LCTLGETWKSFTPINSLPQHAVASQNSAHNVLMLTNSFDMPLSSKTMSKTTQNKREYNPDYIK